MSYREAWVFVRHLPADSWTQTVIRDEHLDELANPEPSGSKFGPWSLLNHQVALLTDAVNRLTHVTQVSAKWQDKQGRPPEPPEPTPRPVQRMRQAPVQSEAAVLYLSRLRARG